MDDRNQLTYRRAWRILVALVLGGWLLAALYARADAQQQRILILEVRVWDAVTYAPIAGADVTVQIGLTTWTGTTGEDGAAHVVIVDAAGTIAHVTACAGKTCTGTSVRVPPGGSGIVDLYL
jgi:hypothetical protein